MNDFDIKNGSDLSDEQQSEPIKHINDDISKQQSQYSYQQTGYPQYPQYPQYQPQQQPVNIPPQYNNSYNQQMQTNDRKGMAVAAMILGIVSLLPFIPFVCSILAIVFGCMSLKSSGKGMALAGIICGSVGIVFQIIFVFIYIVFTSGYIY